jgi:pimeloyl-ACP methyl ester carboxylesterase
MSSAALPTVGARFRLRDGRWLGYAEYGDPAGRPIFSFHGNPGSRLTRNPNIALLARLGARLIAVERPGYGLSDFKVGRAVLDWPDDVAELADGLGIARFAVVGGSGGGPYTLACAHQLPQRLTAVVVISSPCPLTVPGVTTGMSRQNRFSFLLGRYLPWPLLRRLYDMQAGLLAQQPEALLDRLAGTLAPSDRAVLARPEVRAVLREGVAEAFRQGGRGLAWDTHLLARPWGFRLQNIAAPVHLWHGARDVLAPVGMGRYLARSLPHCDATFLPDEGHLLVYGHWEEILAQLIA